MCMVLSYFRRKRWDGARREGERIKQEGEERERERSGMGHEKREEGVSKMEGIPRSKVSQAVL